MISEIPGQCFVYITLPGRTEPVTAGRFAIEVDRRGVPEGKFVYGRTYLARPDAVPIDPVENFAGYRRDRGKTLRNCSVACVSTR